MYNYKSLCGMYYPMSYHFVNAKKRLSLMPKRLKFSEQYISETDDPPVPPCPSSSEDESEDEDYAPPEDVSDDDGSDTDTDSDYERPDDEEVILKKDT